MNANEISVGPLCENTNRMTIDTLSMLSFISSDV